ncbi:hypothetical protein V1512DRAFT_277886 [Lipomyces arxii]|uniref:uncharacterized protein n=1 Tax=Lipomyces arxii TaxID=56418 RepID=UPI0034CD3661
MADDYNYEIDIYDDDNLDEQHTQNTRSNQVNQSQEVQGGTARQENGKWQVLIPHVAPDNRQLDPNSTSALSVADLGWWITEEEVRGWAAEAGVEFELKDVTFNEHKANGKSRGAVFMEFISPQAATAVKHLLSQSHRYNVSYFNPKSNPFKMIPKDSAPRNANSQMGSGRGGNMSWGRGGGHGMQGRGGYGPRGGSNMGNAPVPFNPNINMGFNPMNMLPFSNRGGMPLNVGRGMPNHRGGPMMNFGGFGGPQGFPQPHFNPAFFNGPDGPNGGPIGPNAGPNGHGWQDGDNPHGSKRQRGPD